MTQHAADAGKVGFNPQHDHQSCIDQALETARHLCKQRSLRLTPIRELVLKLVWQSHQPMGAYELLPALADAGFNSAPPTVYRALEFLQQQGFVHRIALLNAFVGCPHPGLHHRSGFLICRLCKRAVELETTELHGVLAKQTEDIGFSIEQETIEIVGLCPDCRAKEAVESTANE